MTGPLPTPLTIGVLALQGDYAAHAKALRASGADAVLVRQAAALNGLDGLVIPGGESTTLLTLLERAGMFEALRSFAAASPVFGTCAGCILLAKNVLGSNQPNLAALDITVERNAYGRQIDSRVVQSDCTLPGGPLEMVFIRAPRIVGTGDTVEILATYQSYPTLVRQKTVLAATFHPELSADHRVHRLFCSMVRDAAAEAMHRTGRGEIKTLTY
ncbi:pyridoxal 5'-phosphate synthase glutaminase subunit PdxT [Acidiphilium sp.]|uniref:pyridoxal 5'-phosphate synthase glutaminase subunit PdxT n=1 Tax=Acidiphilium sp. TaxID=527 RepID=UPI003D030A29